MMLVDAVVHTSRVHYTVLLVAYVTGVATWLYELLLARLVRPRYTYAVTAVRPLGGDVVEVSLCQRTRKRLRFTPGQFVFVSFRGRGSPRATSVHRDQRARGGSAAADDQGHR